MLPFLATAVEKLYRKCLTLFVKRDVVDGCPTSSLLKLDLEKEEYQHPLVRVDLEKEEYQHPLVRVDLLRHLCSRNPHWLMMLQINSEKNVLCCW